MPRNSCTTFALLPADVQLNRAVRPMALPGDQGRRPSLVEIFLQGSCPGLDAQPLFRPGFDLTHALAREPEARTDLLQGFWVTIQPKPLAQDLLLACRKFAEQLLDFL